jgi:thiol-disulfide isomerase/thioredoxin
MNANRLVWAAAALAIAAMSSAEAAEPTLKVGDPAPKLSTGKWVQGEPINKLEKGKAYLVEFWATWCGPCRVSIPHLNDLHNEFKDKGLVVIGQDCWERDESLVEPFIKSMGEKMTYRVALDDKRIEEKGAMAVTWMEAAGRSGIPSAFLVNKDMRVAWIGHPMQLKSELIQQVLDGKHDIQKAATEYQEREASQAKLASLSRDMSQQVKAKDWAAVDKTLADMEKAMPEADRPRLDFYRMNLALQKEEFPEAFKLARRISDANKSEAMLQNQIAWELATRPEIKERDLEVLELIATRANDAAQAKDPAILDTLARVQFMHGKKAEAVKNQEKAVTLAGDSMKEDLQRTLQSYKEGKLPEVR